MENSSTFNLPSAAKQKNEKTHFLKMIMEDIQSALKRDPAARNGFEVLVNYSGLHAIWLYRITHWLWTHKIHFVARYLSQFGRWLTGVEIHPGAVIGRRFFIDHGMGIVIGETAQVGQDVTLYHGVTLGGVSLEKGKRHPTLGDKVVVGAGAKILGDIEIGSGSRIGANAVVVKPVPPESVVVGIPGQVIKRTQKTPIDAPDLHHDRLPDALGEALQQVIARLERVEEKMDIHEQDHIHLDEEGCWICSDSII